MKLKLWGVRGSRPVHKEELLGYGGNSTSVEFVFDDRDFHLFLDGGSGLANAGYQLGTEPERRKFYFLITHTHWDHILGFPFFLPFCNPGIDFTFFASETSRATFADLFFGLQQAQHLPIPPYILKAQSSFQVVAPGQLLKIEDDVLIKTHQMNHQGVTLGYRVENKQHSAAVITDNAPIENGNYLGEGMRESSGANPADFESNFNMALVEFLRNCHTVVFDTHFTEANLKPDWGHSTPLRALGFCAAAGVKRLILFHHAPEDSDTDVEEKLASVNSIAEAEGIEVACAREGEEWEL